MSNDDWKYVEERLRVLWTGVELMCDGYRIRLDLKQISQFRNVITVTINGWFRGKWLMRGDVNEEGRRFFPTRQRYLYSGKSRAVFKKMSKQTLKRLRIDPDEKYSYKDYAWRSFNALKKHLIENNQSIELRQKRNDE
ncbi:MAG: hypothetical protein JRC60_07915 [Deltaproteobacteria bacterium]|nr:hypothetical protein [Deltaproteobacteria bacterium]